jgi:NADPH:quinone reductase-like Zn-dependent oxidoreductase
MKAIHWTNYGPPNVLRVKEVVKPVPKSNEVLIKVHAASVTAGDCELRELIFPLYLKVPLRLYIGLTKPKRKTILGQDFSSEIESTGNAVSRFKVGDHIFGTTGFSNGSYAEFICLPEKPRDADGVLAVMPTNMTFEEAATIPTGGLEALHFIRKANIQRGQKVLINGAGGSIGTIAVQLAKHNGAEVTAVDSTDKLDMLSKLGADYVIDYTSEDFTQNKKKYDVIFDVVGKSSFSRCVKALNKNGYLLIANPKPLKMIKGAWVSRTTHKNVYLDTAMQTTENLLHLKKLIESGKIKTVIDRCYPMEQIAAAHSYVDSGQKKGNVVILVYKSN